MAQLARQQEEEARKEDEEHSISHSGYEHSAADEASEGQQHIDNELHHYEDDVVYNRDNTEPITDDAEESIASEHENSKYDSEEETA